MTDPTALDIELFLRGGIFALALLLAGLIIRAPGATRARLGALFALGVAAFALCGSSTSAAANDWLLPARAIAAGNNLVFYLFAAALFDDDFRLPRWALPLWCVIALAALLCAATPATDHVRLVGFVRPALAAAGLLFAALAAWKALAAWSADLVQERRRLRVFVVGAASVYIALLAASDLVGVGRAGLVELIAAASLLAILLAIAAACLRIESERLFVSPPAVAAGATAPVATPSPGDVTALEAIDRAMRFERFYRRERLTVGDLADHLGMPEHRLRKLINGGLGHRNFNAFLNGFRLEDAKLALADPAQASVPVLTIALDAGFGSLGPFNRAFKAQTGMTPTEFRRDRLAEFEFGEPIPTPPADNPISARDAAE